MHERYPAPRLSGDIATDSGDLVRPHYEIVCRPVSQLAPGDLLLEPILGEVRVVGNFDGGWDNLRHVPLRQLLWIDDNGLSQAIRSLPEDDQLPIRRPALVDRAYLSRALDQADYFQRPITPHAARLIAAHLHRSVSGPLYALAAWDELSPQVYNELDQSRIHPSRALHRWADALTAFCRLRETSG